ncbi:MAG: AMP-binding protein [Methanomicrobiales archaeon]
MITSGGGQLLPAVSEAWDKRYHIPVAVSYWISETIVIGSGTTTLPEYPQVSKNYQSLSVAVGYAEVKIVDTADPEKEMAFSQTGKIALRGLSAAHGYWRMP